MRIRERGIFYIAPDLILMDKSADASEIKENKGAAHSKRKRKFPTSYRERTNSPRGNARYDGLMSRNPEMKR